jgi:hypothetical protein
MTNLPMVQLALDYVALPPALAVAQLVHKEVERGQYPGPEHVYTIEAEALTKLLAQLRETRRS